MIRLLEWMVVKMSEEIINKAEAIIAPVFKEIESTSYYNSRKVLEAFWNENIN